MNTLGRQGVFWKLFLVNFRAAERVSGSCFVNTLGRRACFGELFCEHFRAAGRVLRSCFVNTLGRQAVFWAKVLGPKKPKIQI